MLAMLVMFHHVLLLRKSSHLQKTTAYIFARFSLSVLPITAASQSPMSTLAKSCRGIRSSSDATVSVLEFGLNGLRHTRTTNLHLNAIDAVARHDEVVAVADGVGDEHGFQFFLGAGQGEL